MKNILLAVLSVTVIIMAFIFWQDRKDENENLEESTQLIQEQIRNVGKLVVTEGSFSQVFTYKNSKSLYFDVLSARKKALVVVNADVSVAYDLSKLETEIDEKNKRVIIHRIPEEEININPNIRYYDVSQDYLNQFKAEDYNKIKSRIEESLKKKINSSSIKSNASNRLTSELQKIYILTSAMGWELVYMDKKINSTEGFENIRL